MIQAFIGKHIYLYTSILICNTLEISYIDQMYQYMYQCPPEHKRYNYLAPEIRHTRAAAVGKYGGYHFTPSLA